MICLGAQTNPCYFFLIFFDCIAQYFCIRANLHVCTQFEFTFFLRFCIFFPSILIKSISKDGDLVTFLSVVSICLFFNFLKIFHFFKNVLQIGSSPTSVFFLNFEKKNRWSKIDFFLQSKISNFVLSFFCTILKISCTLQIKHICFSFFRKRRGCAAIFHLHFFVDLLFTNLHFSVLFYSPFFFIFFFLLWIILHFPIFISFFIVPRLPPYV